MATPKNWVLYRSAAYLGGRGVTLGSPIVPALARAKNVGSISIDPCPTGPVDMVGQTLDTFATQSLDHVFVGPKIEIFDDHRETMLEAATKLKVGGHMLVNTKVGNHENGVTEFYPSVVSKLMEGIGNWQVKGQYEANGQALQVFKKLSRIGRKLVETPKPRTPRACVIRYGALGDAIVLTPLLRELKERGYFVTLNISPYCRDIFFNNPYIDNIVLQEREMIPNPELAEYWGVWEPEYEKYINLSESMEGDLLRVEGRNNFYTTQDWRHRTGNKNYYDYVFERAGMPEVKGHVGELFFDRMESGRAGSFVQNYKGKFKILWALNGSSHHKVYPLMENVLEEWLNNHPDSMAITVGDYTAKLMEFDHPQLLCKAGVWSIRESLIATKYVDLVIGPETMITNASGCFDTPKITLLSHSTHENLCKYWKNDYCLAPDRTIAPCYPCHQLHYTKESCCMGKIVDTVTEKEIAVAPLCATAISPIRVLEQINKVYQLWKKKQL